ncbi:MAG: hypothetical protein CVU56_24810 [Deltaproteobacteria bacterium HGW-Deltaproteobacteria-14]|jgi:hypothetical protein|nr:MAG: hypothetical protein CVU56_24810 [Deltaproteobacteria bacterium HGW-Deltaproteobacteria-14]
MNRIFNTVGGALLAACLFVTGCSEANDADGRVKGPALGLEVAPLELPGVTDACYSVGVFNAADPSSGETVWSEGHICADQYGDNLGAIAYVGPCDADGPGGERMNSVRLIMTDLCAGGSCVEGGGATSIPAAEWDNPCPAPDGCVKQALCSENQDTPVVFNLTVMRDAKQGFFDIAVNFEDIFCSAKLDCADDEGQDIDLLYNGAARDATVVAAVACTSGPGDTCDTHVYMNDMRIDCYASVAERDADAGVPVSTYTLSPAAGPGNAGAHPPLLFQTANYWGVEQLPQMNKVYWTTALGIVESELTAGNVCVFHGSATAGDHLFSNGQSPQDTWYPFIEYAVNLNEGDGLSCGQHPLNEAGSGVQTVYTDASGMTFGNHLDCGTEDVSSTVDCSGAVPALAMEGASITSTGSNVVVTINGVASQAYSLGAGTVAGCCVDPCQVAACADNNGP